MHLISDIFSNLVFIKADGTHAITFGPEVSTPISLFEPMIEIEYFMALLPFRNPTASDTEYFGGIDTSDTTQHGICIAIQHVLTFLIGSQNTSFRFLGSPLS